MLIRFITALALMAGAAHANLNGIVGDTSVRIANISAANMSIKFCGHATGYDRFERQSVDGELTAGKHFIINVNDLCDRRIIVRNTYGTVIWDHKIPHGHGGTINITTHGTIFGQWVNQTWWNQTYVYDTDWVTCNNSSLEGHRICPASNIKARWN